MIIEVGDRVQSRKGELPNITAAEFDVTAINGTVYSGAANGDIDTTDGWSEPELIHKDPANLRLPESLSEIRVTLQNDPAFPRVLIGKGDTWRDEQGTLVPVSLILDWTEV